MRFIASLLALLLTEFAPGPGVEDFLAGRSVNRSLSTGSARYENWLVSIPRRLQANLRKRLSAEAREKIRVELASRERSVLFIEAKVWANVAVVLFAS